MEHQINPANWHMSLADAIKKSNAGDTIIVHSKNMKELALMMHSRMCPDKAIKFRVAEPEIPTRVEELAERRIL